MKKGSFYGWMILLLIASQPVFDAVTYWIMKTDLPNVMIYVRAALLVALAVLAFVRNRFKPAYLVITALYFLYLVAQFWLIGKGLGSQSLTNVSEAFRAFLMPLTLLWIIWYASRDEETIGWAWKGVAWAGAAIAAIVVLSLVTGTNYPTYNKPQLSVGLSGWFYSGNAQSIILAAVAPFVLAYLLQKKNVLWLLAGTAATWALLFFNGTRVAYIGLVLVLVALLCVMAAGRWLLKNRKYSMWSFAILASALVLTAALYPVSILNQVNHYRGGQESYLEQNMSGENAGHVGLLDESALGEGTTEAQKQIVRDYNAWAFSATAGQILNVRQRQMKFVMLSMQHADARHLLFGYGFEWFSAHVGEFETDYVAILGCYGVVGTLVFFAPVVWALVQALRFLFKSRFRSWFTAYYCAPAVATALLLGVAMLAGRSFEQTSVSIYLSLGIALLYLMALHKRFTPAGDAGGEALPQQ